jgi:hypothetical protein
MRIVNKTSSDKVKLPVRGYAVRTYDEKLVVIKGRSVDYEKLSRSLAKAFCPDKHLFVEMIRVAV